METDFAKLAYSHGYWVHLFATKIVGQPCDAVIVKDNIAWFLDVKHVADKDYFLHSRIEVNQMNVFEMLSKRNFNNIGFIIYFSKFDTWNYLPYSKLDKSAKKTHYTATLSIEHIFSNDKLKKKG